MTPVEELCDEIAMLKTRVEKGAAEMASPKDALVKLAAANAILKEALSERD